MRFAEPGEVLRKSGIWGTRSFVAEPGLDRSVFNYIISSIICCEARFPYLQLRQPSHQGVGEAWLSGFYTAGEARFRD